MLRSGTCSYEPSPSGYSMPIFGLADADTLWNVLLAHSGFVAKDKVLILFGCSSECLAVDGWEVQSNRLSAKGARSQGCGFAAELTSNRKVWAGLMVKKTKYGISFYGRLAQRSEQPAHNRSVLGSNPRASTTFFLENKHIRKDCW